MTDQPKPTPCCSVLFPQRDAVSPKDVHGCVLANGHHGPHQFFATNLRQYSWSTDMECNCDDCQSDEPANWCTVYREVTAAPELQQRVDELERDYAKLSTMFQLSMSQTKLAQEDNQRLRDRVDELERKSQGYVEHITSALQEIEELRAKKFHHFNDEDCWIYQGDGNDHLESLVCPVVISTQTLMALESDNQRLRELLRESSEYLTELVVGINNAIGRTGE